MGKDKLDLNNLLAKYETGQKFYQPVQNNESIKRMEVQQQFYGKRTNPSNFNINSNSKQNIQFKNIFSYKIVDNNNQHKKTTMTYNATYIGNFQTSKQQCRDFLQRIKSILQDQRSNYQQYPSKVLHEIKIKFQQEYKRLRKQIQQALDQAFRQNYKKIQQQLHQQVNKRPGQFDSVNKSIVQIQQEINKFLEMLSNTNTYREAISKVVINDYTKTIQWVRDNVKMAKSQYVLGLGEIQPDRSRIQCLKNDLNRLFYFKRKQTKIIQKSIFSVLGGGSTMSPNKNRMEQPMQREASRTRKTFFNFGNN